MVVATEQEMRVVVMMVASLVTAVVNVVDAWEVGAKAAEDAEVEE